MSIFDKIFNPFSKEGRSKKEDNETSSITDVGVLEEKLKEVILDSVAPFTGDDTYNGITIWINDEFFHVAEKDSFATDLRASFDSMKLHSLGNGEIKVIHGEPEANENASPIFKKNVIQDGKIWIKLHLKGKETHRCSKALITVFPGRGSCEKSEYVLDAEKKTIYRIGRGPMNQKAGEAFRLNDIVIEESNPDQTIQKLNNFVSGSQADIIFEDGVFYLKAMPSGCRMNGGSPTKIIRGGKLIELRDHISSYKLHDGDYIELGKSVLLLFKITEN